MDKTKNIVWTVMRYGHGGQVRLLFWFCLPWFPSWSEFFHSFYQLSSGFDRNCFSQWCDKCLVSSTKNTDWKMKWSTINFMDLSGYPERSVMKQLKQPNWLYCLVGFWTIKVIAGNINLHNNMLLKQSFNSRRHKSPFTRNDCRMPFATLAYVTIS